MIAIRDFKMPENCIKCPMQFGGWCYVSPQDVDERVAPTVDDAVEQGKPEWCPLVDVPDEAGNCSEIPNNSDCVGRRAAVEAMANKSRFSAEEIINICDKSVQDENGWIGGLKEAILAVLELPSAQPKLDEWCTDCKEYDHEKHCCPRYNRVIREAVEEIRAERKKGQWIKPTGMMPPEYAGVYRCSECDEIAMRDWGNHKQTLSNFCPNCGCQMNGG